MRTKIASSSSSSTPRLTYDVFLSFRGKDTRNGFTDHLYAALKQKGILTFRDDEKLEKGKSISPELLKAIKESKLAIVIFSKNYASSTWCLDELTKIIGCMEETGMTILPIFYHVDPSDVRKQIGTFAKAFVEHEKENIEKVQTWRAALKKVAEISGWHLPKGSEAKFIQDIVEVAFDKLNHKFSIDTKGLVGINSRVEQLKSHLAIGSEDVRIIGIWGIGGMGKTTLARVVYDMVSDQFEACSFIANVRENSKKITWLQKKLLKELLKCKDVEVEDVNNGVLMLKNRLRCKKVLLVLDDVNQSEQLDKLAGGHDSFGPGSRVMITTRDKHLLVKHRANRIYEVEPLNNAEALQLFSLKAFEKDHPDIDYVELSQAFVCYSRGLPLALEVLGSFLINRSIHEWKSDLDRLKKFPKRKILDVLQISFDGLEEMEKEIFLNIACFFNHENQETIKEILDILGFSTEIGLSVLREKSLIKLSWNHVWMHDLLQEMGRDIVCHGCNDPGEYSRLWLYGDIDNVLTKNTGTKKIKGIVLELYEPEKVDWDPQAFSKMQNLKLLIIKNVHLMHGPKILPKDLRFLDWSQYPLKSLPSSFQSNELVKLCLNCSYIERLWEGAKSFRSLKFIQSNKSLKLIETPDFTEVPHLEILILEDCINLWKIHPSIRFLKKLTHLNLKGCKNLRNLPTFLAMESLNILNFSGCSKVKRIPEFGENMKRLSKLFLDGTAITELPTSIGNLTNLAFFSGRDCKNLLSLPSTFSNMKSLKHANFSGCSKLLGNLGTIESVGEPDVSGTSIQLMPSSYSLIQDLKKLISIAFKPLPFYSMSSSPDPLGLLSPSLKTLNLSDCNLTVISNDIGRLFSLDELKLSGNSFECLPKSIAQLPFLKSLWLDNCTSLRSLPKLPIKIDYIRACGCTSLEMVPDLLKPNSSCEPRVYLIDCNKLANNQAYIDVFIARIKKHHQVLSQEERYDTLDFEKRYDIIIPGSEIPKWFTHQRIGVKVNIKEPSHLCKENEWIGIAVCALFCPNPRFRIQDGSILYCCLIVNGKTIFHTPNSSNFVILSDHIWLLYLVPEYYGEDIKNLLRECDADGFNHIEIRFISHYSVLEVNENKVNICMAFKVKKCGLRMVYKKDIEDLNRTMAQDSNDNIKGLDVPFHSANNSKSNKLKQRRDDYNGAGPSGEGSSRVTDELSDLEESREYLKNLLFFLPHLVDKLSSISVHHGHHFTENGRKYVSGVVNVVDNCDPARWSKVEIKRICRDFRYTIIRRLWYKMPGVDQELADFHLIVDDSDAMHLTELVRGHEDIYAYVEYPIHDLKLVDERKYAGEGVQPLALEQDFIGYYDNNDGSEHDDHDGDDFYSFYDSDGMYTNDQTFNNEDELEVNADVSIEVAASQVGSRRVGKEPIIEHPPEVFHISDSSDSMGSDGGGSGLEDDVELNHGDRDFVEESSDSWDGKDDVNVNEPGQMGASVMNSDYESEELHSLMESSSDDELGYDSDDKFEDDNRTHVGDEREQKEEQVRNFPVFKPVAKAEHIYFEKDMLFTTPKQFKEAITDYAVHGGWGIKFVENDLQRVRAVCQEGCKFVAYLTKVPKERSYQLRTLTLEHTCFRSYKNPRCTSSYIGKKLLKKVKRQPNTKLRDIQETVHDKYTLNISAGKASRARDKAREYVDGAYTQQYNQLWEYCEELRRASPGSTILMKVHTFYDGDLAAEMDLVCGVPYFERLYICLEGCKKGFLAGCRPFIGLDACHLKNKLGGQLIIAVCRDPNEEYFPLAYAVVEAETKDSWTWFINLLLADIGQNRRWVFMSDQLKGLVQTFIDNWPQYEHRICCRYLYNNFRKNHPGVLIRELFWRAAKATYKEEFDRVMEELKGIDAIAHSWLDAYSTTKWARHMFSEDALTDTIVNNMCESFKSRILKFKSKPIISMLECIRLYLITRFQENREKILRVESDICVKVLKRLHKEKLAVSRWFACWAGQTQFEVKNGLQSFTVDLATAHCSCRKWDINGIPCAHAIACIFFNRQDAEQYVHPCYRVSTYKACYEPIISTINGLNMWRPSGVTLVQPSIKRRPPGKPKKKIARESNELISRRSGISKQCKACGKLGHNKRSCKGEIGGNSSLPGTTNRTSTSNMASMHSFSSTPSAPPQSSMHSPSTPSALYQSSMPSFRLGAPPQSSMHSQATPTAPYQSSKPSFRPGAPSQAKTSSATQFAPSQTRMHQSSPNVTRHAKASSSNPF